jgi:hypothetical protein
VVFGAIIAALLLAIWRVELHRGTADRTPSEPKGSCISYHGVIRGTFATLIFQHRRVPKGFPTDLAKVATRVPRVGGNRKAASDQNQHAVGKAGWGASSGAFSAKGQENHSNDKRDATLDDGSLRLRFLPLGMPRMRAPGFLHA